MSEHEVVEAYEPESDLPAGFRVDDDRTAEWAVNRIKEHRAAVEMWTAHYAAQLERIKARSESSIAYLEGLLRAYFETVPKRESKTQARYTLPNAELILKAQQPAYDVDEETVMAFLEKEGGAHIKTKKAIDWAGLKKTLMLVDGEAVDGETGEIIPGITITERPDKFEVRIK